MKSHWERTAVALTIAMCMAGAQTLDPAVSEPLRAGRHAEALSLATEFLKRQPRNPALWTAHGMALRGLNRTADSLASFAAALAVDARYLPALRAAADTAYGSRAPSAAAYIERLLKLDPNEPTANAMGAVLQFEAGDCAQALLRFDKARQPVEQDPAAAAMFAHCLLETNRASDAVALLEASLARREHLDTRYNLALALKAAGRGAEAIALLKHHSDTPAAQSLLGVLHDDGGDLEKALALLNAAVAAAPPDERPYLDFALVATRHGNWDQAIEISTAGLAKAPRSARLYSIRGAALAQRARLDEAERDFDAADRLAPARGLGAVGRSTLLAEQNQPTDAARLLRQRLRARPADPMLHYLLAYALTRAGAEPGRADFTEARTALERAVQLQPVFPAAHALLGKLRRGAGETERAIKSLRLALAQDPGNRQALQQLVIALRSAGRSGEAATVAESLRQELNTGR